MAIPEGNEVNFSGAKLNVLVYTGSGRTVESVRHCSRALQQLLAPHYAITPVTRDMIVKEPWENTCALLVISGGTDQDLCQELNGAGNLRISQFVRRGGKYIGFSAGGHYASKRCEFEVGDKSPKEVGERELAFFPGTCRGSAFQGFVHDSEAGARAVDLAISKKALTIGAVPAHFRSYFNGGGVFLDASCFADQGVEVLASYAERLDADPGNGAAAIVYCQVGEGAAILSGPHPDFAAANFHTDPSNDHLKGIVGTLAADDMQRINFLKACLSKLGLTVTQETIEVPPLSSLHLSGIDAGKTSQILLFLEGLLTREGPDQNAYLKDEHDTFCIERPGLWNSSDLMRPMPDESMKASMSLADHKTVIKRLVAHDDTPSLRVSPYFDHNKFYLNLRQCQSESKEPASEFGTNILYGEVLTSTNTILEKNTKLLRCLPHGLTATATLQIAGRGRGSNIWVSPAGALVFSTVVRHHMDKTLLAPVQFIQHLSAMAVIRGIKSYAKGYENIPVKLKWPNDIYALDPADPDQKKYTKICGILINTTFIDNEFVLVVGPGINVTNPWPTTSLTALAARYVPTSVVAADPITPERLLARILTTFEELYIRFARTGFDQELEAMYYEDWLHTDQIVTLEEENGARARIRGITRDYGLLLAEELSWDDRSTGRTWQLQGDYNSFDFFHGLVKRKV